MTSWRLFLALLLLVLAAPAARADTAPTGTRLIVFTVEYPPYVQKGADGVIRGESTARVRALLDAAGIAYDIRYTPWARAVVLAAHEPGALIYPLTRTPEREAAYRWIAPIAEVEFHLMGDRQTAQQGLNRADITSGRYSAVCEVMTIQCDLLADYGFPNRAIIRTSGTGPEGLVNMILHNRGEFLIADPKVVGWHLAHMPEDASDRIISLGERPTRVTDYLAASPRTDPALLSRLEAAAKTSAPAGRR